jgi:hypothetical protein
MGEPREGPTNDDLTIEALGQAAIALQAAGAALGAIVSRMVREDGPSLPEAAVENTEGLNFAGGKSRRPSKP